MRRADIDDGVKPVTSTKENAELRAARQRIKRGFTVRAAALNDAGSQPFSPGQPRIRRQMIAAVQVERFVSAAAATAMAIPVVSRTRPWSAVDDKG